ncbi:heterokaryon incompatibility protein domain-containing protein [Trichoderma chlorosporum]
MRLIDCANGRFQLIKAPTGDIPKYAILSHTWGPDTQEVTFKDLVEGTGTDKTGYDKIRFCAAQARHDGLRYIWVDTCCIDKTNNTELAEAINSMFRWYQNAARCYVYLSDISDPGVTNDSQQSELMWESAFRKSRWFTRGWTLQELLAPASVEFFTKEGLRIGDKRTLEQQIHEITSIAVQALRGQDLLTFTVEERFKWAETRQTTHEEDWVYCLLGIFGIFLPLIYGEGKANAIRRLKKEIADATARDDATNSYTVRSCIWMVPFERNPAFTSRETDLKRIRQMLFAGQQTSRVAISGLGGVGKTQLALELAYRIMTEYKDCSIIWIPTTNKESLEQAYFNAAVKLGISSPEDTNADAKKLVQDHLSNKSAGRWLLIFDNADDVSLFTDSSSREAGRLIDYIPRSVHGSVVFTTRDKRTAVRLAGRNVVEISEMNEVDGKQLLAKYLVNQDLMSQGDVTALLDQLMYLPLAIVQAAVYINANGIGLDDYLSLLKEQEEDVIDLLSEDFEDERRYQDLKNPIATTWLISFQQIRQRDPLAADYLSFMACVDAKDIPVSLLPPAESRKREIEAIGTLQGYSFIAKRSSGSAVTIHRLVHLAMRNWLQREGLLSQWTSKTIVRLAEMMEYREDGLRTWRPFMPHAHYVLGSRYAVDDDEWKMTLLWRYAQCLSDDGRYKEAEELQLQAMEGLKMKLGADHIETHRMGSNLALTYQKQGRWKEAEQLETQVMESLKAKLGVDHIDTLVTMGNLATTYQRQDRWEEAEELETQVMEARKMKLGANHPDTLRSMTNLVVLYWKQSRWDDAERLGVQVMEGFKMRLGSDHPITLESMNNLTALYGSQGRWEEAEMLGLHVMEAHKKSLGPDHPSTLSSMHNLAALYRSQGRWEEAEILGVQVMEARRLKLGANHPETLGSMRNLAFIWKGMNRHGEALSLMQECFGLQQHALGAYHLTTLTTQSILREWQGGDT